MTYKTKAFGAAVVLAGAGIITTVMNDPDIMKGFVNSSPESGINYDDGPERVAVRLTWGKGQLAHGLITVSGHHYINKTLDSIKDRGGSSQTWILHPNKGNIIIASVMPRLTNSGSTCSIVDPKHPEMIKEPAVTAHQIGGSTCHYTVLG